MSLLYLVRHGQASFFADDYDQLSELGELQASRLGEEFLRRGVQFHAIFSGPARRQQSTARIIAETLKAGGAAAPAIETVPGLMEHSGDKFLSKEGAKQFLQQHPELTELEQAYRQARDPIELQRQFQKLFEAIVHRWTSVGTVVEGVEPFQHFHDRVSECISEMLAHEGRGRRALAVSSVGPISIALHNVLGTSLPAALELGWRIRNSSVTTIVHTRGRTTLDLFNSVSHLNEDEITYR